MTSPPRQRTGSGVVAPRATSMVTRHLSVGAFVDETFSSTVVRQVLNQTRRQAAHAYGPFHPWVLPPRPDWYKVMDSEDSTGTVSYLKAIWRGFLQTPATMTSAPQPRAS